MPELPEVETVRRGLHRLLVGRTIAAIEHGSDKSFPNDQSQVDAFMIGATITKVTRRAKVLLIELSTEYTLMIHLKMTGQLVFVNETTDVISDDNTSRKTSFRGRGADDEFISSSNGGVNPSTERWGAGHPNDSLVSSLPDRSTRVAITFKDDSRLFFNDQRRFGWVKLLPNALVMEEPFMQKVGPEPLEITFTDEVFLARIARRKGTTIKAAILDQTVLAGIGNIYADEGLWMSKIHPATRVRDVSGKQLRTLRKNLVEVLQLSIDKGGSTNRNYVDAEGNKGSYMEFANVFRREGKPCNRCGATIEKSRVAGRGTHTCPTCQRSGKIE